MDGVLVPVHREVTVLESAELSESECEALLRVAALKGSIRGCCKTVSCHDRKTRCGLNLCRVIAAIELWFRAITVCTDLAIAPRLPTVQCQCGSGRIVGAGG